MNSVILEVKAHISYNPDLLIFITARFSYKMVDVTLGNYTETAWNKLKVTLLPASLLILLASVCQLVKNNYSKLSLITF